MAIRSAIFAGELSPKQTMSAKRLASDFKISEGSGRDALWYMTKLGLVTRTYGRGRHHVVQLTDQETQDRLAVFHALVSLVYTPTDDPQLLDAFAAHADQIRYIAGQGKKAEAALTLHVAIWKTSGNQQAATFLEQLATPLFAFGKVRYDWESHRRLVAAYMEKDAEKIQSEVGAIFKVPDPDAGMREVIQYALVGC